LLTIGNIPVWGVIRKQLTPHGLIKLPISEKLSLNKDGTKWISFGQVLSAVEASLMENTFLH
jgi:hypothetical protein